MIYFEPTNHIYCSISEKHSNIKWTSVTRLLGMFHEKFNEKQIATKCSKASKGKWSGYSYSEILKIWDDERKRAVAIGNWYHDQREKDILGVTTLHRRGKTLPIIHPMYDEKGRKVAQSQKLIEGVYPELMIYLASVGICGQADLVEISDGYVHIIDYKTNKEIKYHSFVDWEGVSKMMYHPIHHLEDCNYNHYALQLSIYMYMILKHNPKLKPGRITIHHAVFKKAGENKHGYPIHEVDNDGNYIVEKVEEIELPYMKQEVVDMINHFKNAS